jgi:deoxycytidylate deaminase
MKYLTGQEEQEALIFIDMAAEIALSSPCFRSRCGSVIVKDNKVIGSGFNSPPKDKALDHCLKDDLPKDFKSDKTCCIHAEQRAIMDALKNNHKEIIGSRLYFIRLDESGKKTRAGDPYCTICSKMALDAGLAEFVLWHEKGVCVYDTEEYNNLSFNFK